MKIFLSKAERIKYLGFDDWWLMLLAIPLASGLSFVLFAGSQGQWEEMTTLGCYLISLTFTVYFWGTNRSFLVLMRQRMPRQQDTPKRILAMLGFAFLTVLASSFLGPLLALVFSSPVEAMGLGEAKDLFGILISFTLCILVLAIYEGIFFFGKYKNSLLERERLAKNNMQAQLAILKQQVNPHFLFNSLNTLTNIIPEDPALATRFTQRLAAVYRRLLEYRHADLISLREEVLALLDYVFLMQTRFEDKLSVKIYCQEGERWQACFTAVSPQRNAADHLDRLSDYGHYQIVPLSLQLLVENAIKHNVISYDTPLEIDIRIGEAYVSVSNRIQLRGKRAHSTGFGQEMIRRRYRAVSDQEVSIDLSDGWYSVRLPLVLSKDPVLVQPISA